jgi:hypothetical protein
MPSKQRVSRILSLSAAVALSGCGAQAVGNSTTTQAAERTAQTGASPTNLVVRNDSSEPVQVNVIIGQPPVTPPAGCTLGSQITALAQLALTTEGPSPQPVTITPQAPGVTTGGYFTLPAHSAAAYRPTPDASGHSPMLTGNIFFGPWNGAVNQGCRSSTFPDAVNLGEFTLNASINGAVGSSCANADDNDISAVNGANAFIRMESTSAGWPYPSFENKRLGENANVAGVFGWGATNCVNNAGYPNPTPKCQEPFDLPPSTACPSNGVCSSPRGTQSYPCVPTFNADGSPTGRKVCQVMSDSSPSAPQGTCNNQRAANTTGGDIVITFKGFIPVPA